MSERPSVQFSRLSIASTEPSVAATLKPSRTPSYSPHPSTNPTEVTTEPTRFPVVRPSESPVTLIPSVQSAVIIFVKTSQSVVRNYTFVHYIVNTSLPVDIRGFEGRAIFTVLPQT
eukprot:gene36201-44652_t